MAKRTQLSGWGEGEDSNLPVWGYNLLYSQTSQIKYFLVSGLYVSTCSNAKLQDNKYSQHISQKVTDKAERKHTYSSQIGKAGTAPV